MSKQKEDFSVLAIKERLNENLSGGQIEIVLNSLIMEAISRIIRYTTLAERMLAEMLPLVIVNTRRHISLHSNEHVTDLLFTYLLETNVEKRIKLFAEMKLERTVPFHILKTFSRLTEGYTQNIFKLSGDNPDSDLILKYSDIPRRMGYKQSDVSFYHVVKEVEFYANLAYTFRSMLMEKYVRLAYITAKKHKRGSGLDIDLDQLFKDLLIGVARGIDKYHSEKGPLTPCVRWWMQDAATQNSSTHENNISYHVPTPRRAKHLAKGGYNFAVAITEKNVAGLESASLENNFIVAKENEYYARIAALADKEKVAFLSHGMMMPLTNEEKAKLQATMLKKAS